MYEKFRELNCIAEMILDNSSKEMNKLTERRFIPTDMGKKTRPDIDFTMNVNEACIDHRNRDARFCDRNVRHASCDEIVNIGRNMNGNDQKLFLFSTKRKTSSPICPSYYVQTEKRCFT